jgi:phosphate acetyltransferase
MKSDSLYISSLEPGSGSLIITMGIMELLKGKLGKVAFFRPVIDELDGRDHDISFILEKYALDMNYKDCYGFKTHEVEKLMAENKFNNFIESLLGKFKKLEKEYDFVVVEGLHNSSFSQTVDFDINISIAKNLGTPYISVLKGKDKSAMEIFDEISIETDSIKNSGCTHIATFVNRINPKITNELRASLLSVNTKDSHIYFLEEVEELDTPTVAEIKKNLGCIQILGEEKDLRRVVKQSKIAAMKLENFLEYLEDGDLIIVPGDRSDIIIGSLSSVFSKNYPAISGILLTGGLLPHKSIKQLFNGFDSCTIPILSVEDDTYTTAMKVKDVPATITSKSERKIALAMGLFSSNVDLNYLGNKIVSEITSDTVTPIMFEFGLFERARANKKRIVLPESSDERILRATEMLLRRDVAEIILLGDEKIILGKSKTLGIDISRATFINPKTSTLMDKYINNFYELRKKKGLTLEIAKQSLEIDSYFGTMMVHCGDADGMVSGAIHTTQDTIRPALQIIKTKPNVSIVSSVFFMCLDTKVLVYGDCAVNQDPNVEQLAQIAMTSSQTAKIFGIEPRVAMLSYSTGDSGKGDEVEKVRAAANLVKEKMPDLLVEGPIQYDAAIDASVAKTKLPNSKVAGKATVFIFPDLNTGNNTYKAVQRSSGAIAIGPVLQGLNKPVNDLSRGCLVADIVNTVAITAIQAEGE